MTSKTDISTGTTTARMDRIVDTMSSAMLTGTLPAPPVVAVTAGRTAAALTAWTLPATIRPAASESTGWISVITLALAAKAMAPAAGRMIVCMASLMWFTAGILSAKNSITDSTTSKAMIQPLARVSQGWFKRISSV